MLPSPAATWVTQQLAQRAARKLVAAFEAEGIRCLLVKGIVVARQLYADPIERPYCDVDVLVRPRDFLRVLRVGRQNGWRRVWDSKTLGAVNLVVDGVAVDIASTVGPPGVAAIGVGDLLGRARRSAEPVGVSHDAIEVHDHALLLAIDAFKDKLGATTKPWAAEDLARVAGSEGFDVPTMIARTREARLATLIAAVARWVGEERGETAWSGVERGLRGEVREGYVARYRGLCARERSRWEGVELAAMTRAVSDERGRRVMAVVLGGVGAGVFVGRHGRLGVEVWERSSLTRPARRWSPPGGP